MASMAEKSEPGFLENATGLAAIGLWIFAILWGIPNAGDAELFDLPIIAAAIGATKFHFDERSRRIGRTHILHPLVNELHSQVAARRQTRLAAN